MKRCRTSLSLILGAPLFCLAEGRANFPEVAFCQYLPVWFRQSLPDAATRSKALLVGKVRFDHIL